MTSLLALGQCGVVGPYAHYGHGPGPVHYGPYAPYPAPVAHVAPGNILFEQHKLIDRHIHIDL